MFWGNFIEDGQILVEFRRIRDLIEEGIKRILKSSLSQLM